MFRRFLPLRWALALGLIFAGIPIGVLFGSSLVLYIKWAARGFGDPAAYALFLAGCIALIGRADSGPRDRFAAALGAGLAFAAALFVRPNLAPAAAILLGGAGLAALWQSQFRRVVGLCLGFLPVLGMALHNWVYGGVLVLFTSTTGLAMSMPPSAYLAALAELLRFDFAGEQLARAIRQVGDWLAGPSESVVMAPLNLVALVVLVRVALWRGADPWLRLIALATLVQHFVGTFFLMYSRYHYLTWLLTLLVVAVWARCEGLDLLQRRFPAFSQARGGPSVERDACTRARAHGSNNGRSAGDASRDYLARDVGFRRVGGRAGRPAGRVVALRGSARYPCSSASNSAPRWSCETNSPRVIMRTSCSGVTSFTLTPGSGSSLPARAPASTKNE